MGACEGRTAGGDGRPRRTSPSRRDGSVLVPMAGIDEAGAHDTHRPMRRVPMPACRPSTPPIGDDQS